MLVSCDTTEAKGTKSGKPFGRPRVEATVERKVRELRAKDWGVNRIARELAIGSFSIPSSKSFLVVIPAPANRLCVKRRSLRSPTPASNHRSLSRHHIG